MNVVTATLHYCTVQSRRLGVLNKGSWRVIVTRCDVVSHRHTHTQSCVHVLVSIKQGLILACTCACVCVSKHLPAAAPLHRSTGTSGSDSNNGSNAGGVVVMLWSEEGGGQSGMRGWYLRLSPDSTRHPPPPTPPPPATATDLQHLGTDLRTSSWYTGCTVTVTLWTNWYNVIPWVHTNMFCSMNICLRRLLFCLSV